MTTTLLWMGCLVFSLLGLSSACVGEEKDHDGYFVAGIILIAIAVAFGRYA